MALRDRDSSLPEKRVNWTSPSKRLFARRVIPAFCNMVSIEDTQLLNIAATGLRDCIHQCCRQGATLSDRSVETTELFYRWKFLSQMSGLIFQVSISSG